ncbi:MAG: Na+/H+ antiporter NhaA [Bdellovibrionaceae bacterium]|nr:Na+/H+ antiporter NhaA [Bdellovibrionales bacterium]MCB9084529.1 Na+/H+ antiporter NhaA [Pseudobdellovibrionaceae bacterium]
MSSSRKTHRAEKVMTTILSPVDLFLKLEASSGILLIIVTAFAMIWANSPWGEIYHHMVEMPIGISLGGFVFEMTVHEWVNDAMMVIFFFVVGLEIKRELIIGELATAKKAALPMFGALGGMVVPALIYHALNLDGAGKPGWGIPMATDIAFAVGVLSLMSRKVPFALKIFLLALAIVDDLGAVIVIAVFYTADLAAQPMAWAILGLFAVSFLKYSGIRKISVYVVLGVIVWFAILKSGVHATIAGVVLGLMTPILPFIKKKEAPDKIKRVVDEIEDHLTKLEEDDENYLDEITKIKLEELHHISIESRSPLDRLVHALHPVVSYIIMPIFALVNAGVHLTDMSLGKLLGNSISLGVILGLFVGKPIGIMAFSWMAVRFKMAQLPRGVTWYHMFCVAVLGGVGFTMALFVGHLALKVDELEMYSKLGILVASLLSAVLGLALLNFARDTRAGFKGHKD